MRNIVCILLPLSLFLVSGCDKPAAPELKPPEVSVAKPLKQDVPEYLYYTGRTAAKEFIEIRARVEGFLEKAEFQEGDTVKAGDVLFVIEREPYETRHEAANAQMEQAIARKKLAEAEAARSRQLLESRAMSVEEAQQREAEVLVANSQVAVEVQKVRQAKIQLDYTVMTSPVAGNVSEKLVDVGNLVGPGDNSLLTTVVQITPIQVYFDLAENAFVRLQRRRVANLQEYKQKWTRVEMGLEDEEGYSLTGQLDFLENQVDPETGTIRVRGEFPNESGLLYPGLFVRLRIPIETSKDALLVKQAAIGTDLGGKYVLLVGDDNVVEQRYVKLGSQYGDMQVVEERVAKSDQSDGANEDERLEGITQNDQYIVKGLQRARPGLPVEPQLIEVTPENVKSEVAFETSDDSTSSGPAPANLDGQETSSQDEATVPLNTTSENQADLAK